MEIFKTFLGSENDTKNIVKHASDIPPIKKQLNIATQSETMSKGGKKSEWLF